MYKKLVCSECQDYRITKEGEAAVNCRRSKKCNWKKEKVADETSRRILFNALGKLQAVVEIQILEELVATEDCLAPILENRLEDNYYHSGLESIQTELEQIAELTRTKGTICLLKIQEIINMLRVKYKNEYCNEKVEVLDSREEYYEQYRGDLLKDI